jgi:hypothetical protein
MADGIFEVELPAVDLSTPMRVAFKKANAAKKAGVVVVEGAELILLGDLIKGMRLDAEKPMQWLVERLREERRVQGKGPHWLGKEFVDYFQPRLETYAAVFGVPAEGIPSSSKSAPEPMANGRFYSIAGGAPTVGKVVVQTLHPWIGRGLALTTATCSCPQGCSYDTADVNDGDPCPTNDGETISCR